MKYKLIYKCIVGSQAYGTNVEGSDVDIKGVYIQDPKEILAFGYKPQFEVNKDEVYYEVRRFIELLGSANPTVLEMLYSPEDCILGIEPEFQLILDQRDKFLTKGCRNSFGGYAVQQIKKARGLNKKMNWEKSKVERKTPIDFCYVLWDGGSIPLKTFLDGHNKKAENCGLVAVDHAKDMYALYYDPTGTQGFRGIDVEQGNSIRLSSIPRGWQFSCWMSYNKDGYTTHCKDYKEYETWLKERNTQRYVDLEEHGQQIDGKNMLHCRRLLDVAMEIPLANTVNVRRENAEYLKSIRKGKVDLEEILTKAEEDLKLMDLAYQNCSLPDNLPEGFQDELLTSIREYGQSTH